MNGKHPIVLLHEEINRLRRRDGEESIGGLALARKLFSHFDEEHNPRVAEALANLGMMRQADGAIISREKARE